MSVMNWRVCPKEDFVEVVDAIEMLLQYFLLKMVIGVDNQISMKVYSITYYTYLSRSH